METKTLTCPNGETVTVSLTENIQLYSFYANIESGFIHYCMDENDADAMNLLKEIALRQSVTPTWVKLFPNEDQKNRIRIPLGIKKGKPFPHEKRKLN